jgi:hypothetical protein
MRHALAAGVALSYPPRDANGIEIRRRLYRYVVDAIGAKRRLKPRRNITVCHYATTDHNGLIRQPFGLRILWDHTK